MFSRRVGGTTKTRNPDVNAWMTLKKEEELSQHRTGAQTKKKGIYTYTYVVVV
jgi:hypothetical protein